VASAWSPPSSTAAWSVTLQISGARGTLVHGIQVDQLIIDHRRVHLEFDDIRGSISMLPLLWQTLQCARSTSAAPHPGPPRTPGPGK